MARTPQIGLSTIIRRNSDILTEAIDDELVMLNLEAGKYYGLDDIASHIWSELEEPLSAEKLCESLTAKFDVDRETCQRETLEFLNWLLAENLVETDETTHP